MVQASVSASFKRVRGCMLFLSPSSARALKEGERPNKSEREGGREGGRERERERKREKCTHAAASYNEHS